MSVGHLLRPPHRSRSFGGHGPASARRPKVDECRGRTSNSIDVSLSSCATRRDMLTLIASDQIHKHLFFVSPQNKRFSCHAFARPGCVNDILNITNVALTRPPIFLQLVPAFGLVAFAVWGLEPVLRFCRKLLQRNDANWKKSRTHYVFSSYMQPLALWAGTILICRVLDPISLTSEASEAVKFRLLNFVRSLSTVLACAFCMSRLIERMQKFHMERTATNDTRSMGFQFVGKSVYTAIWVASISLFMELLGFSTQKWLTAGGLGTVLLTLAGREIFTNFLSSLMIHATRPFAVNHWIQTKIEGYEVSGTVERVGWWSPTIVRGEDQEAIHIPNHKFTLNVVRNLSQKTHWRIKTHLAISHLDANKITNIVADMRKVLAKNPQIEQQRLHRRIFLEYIDTQNQAFMILVSCFVRTSHFEEYLCVKEAVLLDLLRIIHHHRARLATPIRTIQRSYRDPDVEDVPVADTVFTGRRRALYLVDSSSRIYGDDRNKGFSAASVPEEPPSETASVSEQKAKDNIIEDSSISSMEKQKEAKSGDTLMVSSDPVTISLEDRELRGNATKGIMVEENTQITSKLTNHLGDGRVNSINPITTQAKQENERTPPVSINPITTPARPPPVSMPLEENIVLGVALDGAKRTLPIEEDPGLQHDKKKEMVAHNNGNELPRKDGKDVQTST